MNRYHLFLLGLLVMVMCLGCNESTGLGEGETGVDGEQGEVIATKDVELRVNASRLGSGDELMRTNTGVIRAENGVIVFTHDQGTDVDVVGFVNSPVGCSEWDDLSMATEPSVETLFHGITEDGWMCVDVNKTAEMIRSQVPDGEPIPGSFNVTGGYRPGSSEGRPVGSGELSVQIDMDDPVDLSLVYAEDNYGRSTRDGRILQPTIDEFDGIVFQDLFDPEDDPLEITASFECLDCTPVHTVSIEYSQSDEMSYYPAHYNPATRRLGVYFDSSDFCRRCTYDMTLDVVSNGKHSTRPIGKVYMDVPYVGGGGGGGAIIITPMY